MSLPRRQRIAECAPKRRRRSRRSDAPDPEAAAKKRTWKLALRVSRSVAGPVGQGRCGQSPPHCPGSRGRTGRHTIRSPPAQSEEPNGRPPPWQRRPPWRGAGDFFPAFPGRPGVFPSRGRAVAGQLRVVGRTCFTILAGVRAVVFVEECCAIGACLCES
ncbi:hypothetical protein TcCL_ESM03491 [Trypanosoma cruzi]|nr:hypothetical protein TcCL_ESM03491 [Trypanosoma cruzi]